MDTGWSLALIVGPLVIGCVVTWWVTRVYYLKSARDTNDLRRLALVTIASLQNAGVIRVEYDAQGTPRAAAVVLRGTAAGSAGGTATLTAPPPAAR